MFVTITGVNNIFRDDEVADRVGDLKELGGFEVEFEVFATAYWQNGERHYRASQKADTIYSLLGDLHRNGCYPLPVQTWTERRFVPTGWDEEVARQIKVTACEDIRTRFPQAYWKCAARVADGCCNDEGARLLETLSNELEGTFDERKLMMFEGILERLSIRRNIHPRTYENYREWLHDERENLAGEVIQRDVFSKDMFAIAHKSANGRINVVVDAVQRNVLDQSVRLSANPETVVSPVYHQTVWYNRSQRMPEVRRLFRDEVLSLHDENYFALLSQIEQLPIAIDVDTFNVVRDEWAKDETMGSCLKAWEIQGREWGIK